MGKLGWFMSVTVFWTRCSEGEPTGTPQSKGQTVPQFGCSIGKRSDSEVFFVVFLVNPGGAKTRLGGEPQMTYWEVARC